MLVIPCGLASSRAALTSDRVGVIETDQPLTISSVHRQRVVGAMRLLGCRWHLTDDKPESVSATGQCHLNGLEDMAYVTVYFSRIMAHINVNWLSPVKVRTTLIGGEKKMVLWNDLEADEKVKVYDKGIEISNGEGVYDLLVSYRSGDMWSPKVDQTEALKLEAKYFVECIEKNETPFNDGVSGLRVVRLLEAAAQSLKERGRPVRV